MVPVGYFAIENAEEGDMMEKVAVCAKCGARLPVNAKFCPQCGAGVKGKERVSKEEFEISGSELVNRVKEIIHEGNIRRIVIKQEGKTLMEIPLTVAAIGALLAPILAAVGALAALVTNCTIEVERIEKE
jgi:ribosomal protein L40E